MFFSDLKIFGMEIQNASKQLARIVGYLLGANVDTVPWEYMNVADLPGEIDDRKSKVITFVINAGMNINANNFYVANFLTNLFLSATFISVVRGIMPYEASKFFKILILQFFFNKFF